MSRVATCDCARTTHEHGTGRMYALHRCRCEACRAKEREYRANTRARQEGRRLPKASTPPPPPPPSAVTARGQFVATFPFHGGMSKQRVRRHVVWPFFELAQQQGVQLLPGDPLVRIMRTSAGVFVRVEQPAVSRRPADEVRTRAAEFAGRHEQVDPSLAAWVTEQLEVA